MRTVMSISLPEKVAEQLERYVAESGRNKSDVVRESISLYLWEARLRESQRRLGARAKKVGIVTEDDALRAIS
jgi:Arc/MetJ-type ribon-helix-helix transcriptional regulator